MKQSGWLVGSIKKGSPTIFQDVVLMVSTQAYLPLGFTTAREYLLVTVPDLSVSYVSLLLRATDIYIKVDVNLIHLDKVSEALFRPLHNVTDEYALVVWNSLVESFDNNRKRIRLTDMTHAIKVEANKAACQFQVNDKTLHSIQ